MAKILTASEMAEIVQRAATGDGIDCSDAYQHFLEDLGTLIADHFGGERGTVAPLPDSREWSCAFHINECVPDDGGVYKNYDADVTWKDGAEDGARWTQLCKRTEYPKLGYIIKRLERMGIAHTFEYNDKGEEISSLHAEHILLVDEARADEAWALLSERWSKAAGKPSTRGRTTLDDMPDDSPCFQ
jgi:hypothetical protein